MENFFNYDFDIKNIAFACYVGKNQGNTVHKNRPYHGIALNLSGEKIYIFESGEKIKIKKNDIIYLPKKSSYTVKNITPPDCYAANFDFFTDITFSPFAVHTKNAVNIIELFKDSVAKWDRKSIGYHSKCKADLYNILYQMQKEYMSGYVPKNKFEIIKPAVSYIHDNYMRKPLSVADLADMCGVTPEYFRSIFSKNFGLSPIKYINNLKLTRAKELLDSGFYSVSESAFLSGYFDISHFSREFKKANGISPAEYKKSSQKAGCP